MVAGRCRAEMVATDLLVFKHDTGLAFVNIGMLLTASMSVLAKFEQVSRAIVDPSQ